VREEAVERPGRFSGFLGGVRLIFDACLFALVLLIIGFIVFANGVDREHSEPQRSADGIAVLTGGMSRIDEAMKLLAEGKAKRVLITGVNRTTTTEELKELASQGDQYFTCCVDIDKEARNTIDNATETSEWVALHHYGSIIVVTSNYHMPRTLVELDHALPNLQKIPYPVAATIDPHEWWHNPSVTRVIFTEYLKFLAVWLRTRFEGDPERSSVAQIISGGSPIKGQLIAEPLWR